MKRFKFWLVWIIIGLFWFISFSNAWFLSNMSSSTISANSSVDVGSYTCVRTDNWLCFQAWRFIEDWITTNWYNNAYWVYCFINSWVYQSTYRSSCTYYLYDLSSFDLSSSCPECQECPEFNTWEVYSGWIKETDIDALWSKCLDMWFTEWNSSWYSTLYINDIWHQSAPFINITIPEEFDWDYNYTWNDTQFDLVISWYNVDYEYIDWIIRTQKFTPDEEDFNSIITQIIPLLIPWLVIILFIWFIFRFIKKLF